MLICTADMASSVVLDRYIAKHHSELSNVEQMTLYIRARSAKSVYDTVSDAFDDLYE